MPAGEHVFTTSTVVPRKIGEVFSFFADATNLEVITPPELRFSLITPSPIDLKVGALIDYKLQLFGIPFKWRTRIAAWEPGVMFVDEQLKGPYAQWIHTHTFHDLQDATQVTDAVRYRLPLFPFGEVALPVVKLQLRRIFGYRTAQITKLLPVTDSG